MTTRFFFLCLIIFGFLAGCHKEPKQIAVPAEYAIFLEHTDNTKSSSAEIERDFWEKRLEKHPEQISYLAPLASSYSILFEDNGDIKNLIKAEELLQEANKKTLFENAGLLRALAKVYISRHRFKESLELLKKADALGVKRKSTQKMMFDAYMELGEYEQAKFSLDRIKKDRDFDYLIRMSKWKDYKGDLDSAINYMYKAANIADKSGNKYLICWTYSNLADYYGHAGNINKSYSLYLKVLNINPNYLYALRGIAWIVFSHDKNVKEASRIIDAIAKVRLTPDLFLFKAELAEFSKKMIDKKKNIKQYNDMLEREDYSAMYNKYNILLQAEEDGLSKQMALEMASEEIENRPTPQSYDLLAWAYFNNGDQIKSLEIIQQYVTNQTFDPESEFHQAVIYKANGLNGETKKLKKRLLKNVFELGPNTYRKIKML